MALPIVLWRVAPASADLLQEIQTDRPIASLDEGSRMLPDGAYTTFRTYEGNKVLRFEDHFLRLAESARLAGRPVDIDRELLRNALRNAITKYPARDARVRLTLALEDRAEEFYVLVEELHTPSPQAYVRGVAVTTRKMQRHNPKAKLTSFIRNSASVREAIPMGINEVLMIGENNRVLEGLSSNFFGVKDGVIWTADDGVLPGITRLYVLEAIQSESIPFQLEGLPEGELKHLEEAFLTSASRAVLPVTSIDGRQVGSGMPGEITGRVKSAYWARIASEMESI